MSAYQYEPLSAPDSIRLLLLEPFVSPRDDILRGTLLNTTLWECDYDLVDNYTALSYVWGSGEKPCQIFLDGQAFAITRSLHDALRDMRDGTRVRRVWADAICINQVDITERNGQVALMGRIYSLAANTVIYLGDLTVHVSGVLAAASPRQPHNSAPVTAEDASGGVTAVAVRDLLSRPWFKLVWVFQELVLSRDPWVQCGRTRVRWNDICRLLLVNVGSQTPFPGYDNSDLQILEDMNAALNRKGGYTLAEALKARRGLGATDPRDFVYANLGVANDGCLEVNYGETTQWIYVQAAKYLVQELGIENLISYLDDVAAGERLECLPSWAPDWRLPSSDLAPLRPRVKGGLENDALYRPVFVERDGIMGWIHDHFKQPGAESLLTGRSLAITETGKFCIVPSWTRPGDIIGYLTTIEMEVIFRPIQIRRRSRVSDAILQAFRESKLGPLYLPRHVFHNWNGMDIMYVDWGIQDDGTVRVEDYRFVGEGKLQRQSSPLQRYFDGYITENELRRMEEGTGKASEVQVFALH